jgi:hypothetical protein
VYARHSHIAERRGTLAGHLTGPFCRYAQTLPATIPLVDLGPGPSLLAQAVVPDPCFWTPELPFLYRARVELHADGKLLASTERPLGIRRLGSRGRWFYYEGRPWVLRGAHRWRAEVSDVPEFRQADAALFVDDPGEALCVAASEQGVLIVAGLDGRDAESLQRSIRRLARHACVGFIVLDDLPDHLDPRTLAPNVVFVQRVDRARTPARWARALLCNELERLPKSPLLPVIAYRPARGCSISIPEHRCMCDDLQRDLAGWNAIAGYLV